MCPFNAEAGLTAARVVSLRGRGKTRLHHSDSTASDDLFCPTILLNHGAPLLGLHTSALNHTHENSRYGSSTTYFQSAVYNNTKRIVDEFLNGQIMLAARGL
jgi:hypothetical protein